MTRTVSLLSSGAGGALPGPREAVLVQLLGYDEWDRAFVAAPAAVVASCAALLLGFGAAAIVLDGDEPAPTGERSSAGGGATARCADAVTRADEALALAQGVEETLATHTVVVDDLMAGRITADEAVARSLRPLTDAARASVDLDVAVQRYEAVARHCRP